MENLISDCFPPIFSYLSLSDLFQLRTVSRRLKQEVEDYLPKVRSLSLFLSTPEATEVIAGFEEMLLAINRTFRDTISTFNLNDIPDMLTTCSYDFCFRRLPFGTSDPGMYEDPTILQNQNHFKRSNFLILNHSSTLFELFLPFIKKYCPNIEKLALVIDDCHHYLPEVSKVLETFPAIKVLLLEGTMKDSHLRTYDIMGEFPPEVFNSILALNRLEELYFFPRRLNELKHRVKGAGRNFLVNLSDRLKVLHFNIKHSFVYPIDCGPEKSLEELACPSEEWLKVKGERLMFPKLKKLILIGKCSSESLKNYSSLPRPSLKIFDIDNDCHSICPISTRNLNYFPGLENFNCGGISVKVDSRVNDPKRIRKAEEEVENYDSEIVPENLKNRTLKHLQVMCGPKTAEKQNRDARRWSKYFVALETCTFLEPEYSKILVSELRD